MKTIVPRLKDWRDQLALLLADKQGATAVEFALIAIPFFILIFGLIEVAILFMFSTTLDYGMAEAARMVRTGQLQQNEEPITAADFKEIVCGNLFDLMDCDDKLSVDARVFSSFSASSTEDSSTQGDDGEMDDGKLTFVMGDANDIVMVRVFYEYQLFTPVMSAPLADMPNGRRLLTSSMVFRNEPF